MLEDDFYFDENENLVHYVPNNKLDRTFIVSELPDELDEYGNILSTKTHVNEVQMSSQEIDQRMTDNGFEKAPHIVLREESIHITKSPTPQGYITLTSTKAIEVVEKTRYVRTGTNETGSTLIEPILGDPTPLGHATNVTRKEILYGGSRSSKFMDNLIVPISAASGGNHNRQLPVERFNSYEALPQKYKHLKQHRK